MNTIRALEKEMSDISEDLWCAGWMTGTEFVLWKAIQNGCRDTQWGVGTIKRKQLLKLKMLSQRCDGWWAYIETPQEIPTTIFDRTIIRHPTYQVFMPLDQWKQYYHDNAEQTERELQESNTGTTDGTPNNP